jgi:NADH-quinone oxidoreductase subunit C
VTLLETAVTRDERLWLEVAAKDWRNVHIQALEAGYLRCEWITAADLYGVHVVSTLANLKGELLIIRCELSSNPAEGPLECEAIDHIYASASFHQREIAQMFGVTFRGATDTNPAFDVDFHGYPLRRSYPLTPRLESTWPGAQDAQARRAAPVPGVNREWTS